MCLACSRLLPCSYTGDEDFSLADAVFDCIGDKGARRAGSGDVCLMHEVGA